MISVYMRDIGGRVLYRHYYYYDDYFFFFGYLFSVGKKKWQLETVSGVSTPLVLMGARPQVSHLSRRAKLRKQRRSEAEA